MIALKSIDKSEQNLVNILSQFSIDQILVQVTDFEF